jgi:predicted TPR repeat methyltransferase
MSALLATAGLESLTERVGRLLEAGRTGAARPLLAAARRLSPADPDLAEFAARLALQEGGLEEAQQVLDPAVAIAPEHPGLRKCRAEVRRYLGDIEGATRDAAEAVLCEPSDPVAKALLGMLMLELGRPVDAVACLREAVGARSADPAFREAFAAALEAFGDADAALDTLLTGIAAAPGRVELRNAAILLCIRRRDFTQAVGLAEAARVAGIADACLFGLKGHALSSLGRHDEASDAYGEALKLGPEDPYVRHLVAAAGVLPSATRAPPEYLRTVFNGYADRFEPHLVSLGYRVPGLFRAVLLTHPQIAQGEPAGPTLDLGCGTGMIGLAIADLPLGPLVGIDLSARMLAHAAAKGLYAELREADVMAELAGGAEHWPLILAGDMLCYFGDLQPLLAAVHANLQPNGWFVCSTEELLPDRDGVVPGVGGWALQRLGRYAHAIDYVRVTAEQAGFTIRQLERQVVRHEANAPVPGLLAVLERGHHAD